ncbi:MAG: 30S ribosomal protein S18 [Chloroflexi bacterium]|nr:30S ribosomal protein S18 [Chloroflexota bacterium]
MTENERTEERQERSSESRDSRDSRDRDSRGGARRGGGFRPRGGGGRRRGRKVCTFCAEQIDTIDYKDISTLSRYVNERGRILPRRRTGTCAKHQRRLSQAIKRARHLALMPFAAQHVREV